MPTQCANQETFLIYGDMRHFCTLPNLCFACNRLVLPRQIYSFGENYICGYRKYLWWWLFCVLV